MTPLEEPSLIEVRVRELCSRSEYRQATTPILNEYGSELHGFLITRLRDHDAANDAFAAFAEALWRGIPNFRWQCSVRVWCYTLARHTASRQARQARRHAARNVPLSQAGPLSALVDQIRTETSAVQRTETKHRLVQLREQLPIEDQTLLMLRVNRQLQWTEIAQILLYDDEIANESQLKVDAARLRKRFQLAKEKLRKMAKGAGILADPAADDDGGSDPDSKKERR